MDAYAGIVKHVMYPLWELTTGNSPTRILRELEQSQYWPRERLEEHQWHAFKRMLTHAYQTCDFYRAKFRAVGIEPGDIRSREDVLKVPTLSKEEVQEHRDEMISSRFSRADLILDMTGGSTGSPTQFFYDRARRDSRRAAAIRHDRWAGWDIGERLALLWGAPQDIRRAMRLRSRLRARIIDRKLILDASSLDEAAMAGFARALLRYRPKTLLAYANTLGVFTQYLRDANITGIAPLGIIASAEVLTAETRALAEKTFGCPVFNRYGSREFALIASECSEHQGLHLNAESLLVEVLEGVASRDTAAGEIVVTDLQNFAMPMIRYRIGDMGRLQDEACCCGRGLPLLEVSGGRVSDFLTATNGKKVSGVVIATYVTTRIPGIRQIQFVQREAGQLTINLVRNFDWSQRALEELSGRVAKFLGQDMRIHIQYTDRIPLEQSGKYRFSISRL